MISSTHIKTKATKIWNKQLLQQAYLTAEKIFPMYFSLPSLSSRFISENFSSLRVSIQELLQQSKEHLGYGYQIIYKDVNHRQLGKQLLPTQVVFNEIGDFLNFLGKNKEYSLFCQLIDSILKKEPLLKAWLIKNTETVINFHDKWTKLLSICGHMRNSPLPQCYIRQLTIPEIDTKWIEQHKKILSELFEQLLPSQAINTEENNLASRHFETRYGFKYDEPLIRFRILDERLAQYRVRDLSIPLSEFLRLDIPCDHIFITENKINGLSFPAFEKAIVIFGLGYGVQSLQGIPWLQEKDIFYWGDIDTHGFGILSQLRSYYPQVKSMLMDQTILLKYQHLWVKEPQEKRCLAELCYLSDEEHQLYCSLQNNKFGENIRLEQERICFGELGEVLNSIRSAKTPE